MSFATWLPIILKIVAVIVAGHLAITKLLPILKDVLSSYIRKGTVVTGVIYIFLFYIGVLVLEFIVKFLPETGNKYLIHLDILTPGIDLVLKVIPFIVYFMLASVVASVFASQIKK